MAEYIDRQAAIDALEWKWAGKAAFDAIKNLPSADVRENVKGKWVFKKGDMVTCDDGWYCSHCKRGFHTNVPYFKDFNFCPMCGAAIEGYACDGDKCEI